MRNEAVVIEVGLNENQGRAAGRDLPISPAECAADALACADRGASVIHWHARDPESGEPRLGDVELYAEALSVINHRVLAYPTYPIEPELADPLAHCWTLAEQAGLELMPIDLGSTNLAFWDDASSQFLGIDSVGHGGVIHNTPSFVKSSLVRAQETGLTPSLGSFDVGHTRTMVHLIRSGALRQPAFLKIFLSGAWATGPFPTVEAIDMHLAQIPPDIDVEWVVVPYLLDDAALIESLARHALELGGGVRMGLGDNPGAAMASSNPALVELATRWASEAGRPVATVDQVRERLMSEAVAGTDPTDEQPGGTS